MKVDAKSVENRRRVAKEALEHVCSGPGAMPGG